MKKVKCKNGVRSTINPYEIKGLRKKTGINHPGTILQRRINLPELQSFEPLRRKDAKDFIYFQIGTPVKYASLSFGI